MHFCKDAFTCTDQLRDIVSAYAGNVLKLVTAATRLGLAAQRAKNAANVAAASAGV